MVLGLRRGLLVTATAVLGTVAGILPAIAGSETPPSIVAVNAGTYTHYWSPEKASVAVGADVTLSNPTTARHGVYWVGGPVVPSCASGVPVGSTEAASGTEWSGTCTFAVAGVYRFYCTVHGPAMSGSVTVGGGTTIATPTTAGPPPAGETTGSSGPATPPPAGPLGSVGAPGTVALSPLLGTASRAVKLGAGPHGRSVRGSVAVSAAGAGGRLEVDLLAGRASLAAVGAFRQLRIGRLVRSSIAPGNVSFDVSLDGSARRALRARGRLAVTVVLLLSPPHGTPLKLSRVVLLRR